MEINQKHQELFDQHHAVNNKNLSTTFELVKIIELRILEQSSFFRAYVRSPDGEVTETHFLYSFNTSPNSDSIVSQPPLSREIFASLMSAFAFSSNTTHKLTLQADTYAGTSNYIVYNVLIVASDN